MPDRKGRPGLRLPRHRPYRVVANPPFGLTTEVLGLLLDDPSRGPERADLTQREDPVLPPWLAPGFVDVLRPAWGRAEGAP